jgi:hypothetical protein
MGSTFIPLAASGLLAPRTLVEVKTVGGNVNLWSEHKGLYQSLINGGGNYPYLDWLSGSQQFSLFGSAQTDTATISVQNISGNTVERDIAKSFSQAEFIGAFVVARIWRADSEAALLTFVGNVTAAEVEDTHMQLSVEGFGNYSAVLAPAYNIDKSCPLMFGSVACGSTSPTPCDQSYGGCLSINRFAGAVSQWDADSSNVQMVQPPPAVFFNTGRAF